jgi:hypothetical protein
MGRPGKDSERATNPGCRESSGNPCAGGVHGRNASTSIAGVLGPGSAKEELLAGVEDLSPVEDILVRTTPGCREKREFVVVCLL